MNMKKQPNIFDFATSELSQDAMFAWLMSWAHSQYRESNPLLYSAAVQFIRLLLNKGEDFSVETIDVGRQWENIDIWAEINDDILLIVEDKIETKEHSNQLERYNQIAQKEYQGKNVQVYCVYVKTGNEPEMALKNIRAKGYHTVERGAILECIGNKYACHPLLQDYYEHLMSIEKATKTFKTEPVAKWERYAWQGFYKELEKHLDDVNWGYVANPSGGFLGMWWHFESTDDVDIYLQFEQNKLCFKIDADGVENKKEVRCKYHTLLMDNAVNHPEVRRPNKFAVGTYMTIACVDTVHIFGECIVNIEEVIAKLHLYEALVSKCAAIANSQ